MRKDKIEILSDATNAAVLRFPGRKFPGMLLQGDTLSTLYEMATEILNLARANRTNDIVDVSMQLTNDLGSRLREYERVLSDHGIDLPYVSPFAEEDRTGH